MKNKLNKNKNIFLNYTKKNILKLKKKYLDDGDYHLIIRNFEENKKKINLNIKKFSKLFGEPLPQNKNGKKFAVIKPNVSLIKKRIKNKDIKLRYHQTNAGGAIHSDGPQLLVPPKYVIMACIKQAKKGGVSIISHSQKIYNFLKNNNPKILKILSKKFYFERRGFNYSNKNIFKRSIFEKKYNNFRFRYLREYIEAAYKLKNTTLKSHELKALNYLDKLLSQKRFQKRYKLNEGDLIILNNNILAHGRSGFKLNSGNQRSLIRIWVR
jgi:alpha-ketoglutarate-dependent taurine dioxygenase|tara:strand:- start:438 stop:1241 length:804 start_codon:yes stop_codon:yes gene_type:complete